MGSPTNAILGMFMLWWGWLGFNCGSTFGISGSKWKLAARSAVSTICSSIAGGIMGIFLSYITRGRKFEISFLINGILGALVAITASCAIVHPWEGLIIGMVGSMITIGTVLAMDKLKVDDPVGCVGTHASGGAWSLLAAGLFSRRDAFAAELQLDSVHDGLFNGGGGRQLGIQLLAVVSILGWSLTVSFLVLKVLDLVVGLRVPLTQELLGADLVEHDIGDFRYDKRTNRLIPLPEARNYADICDAIRNTVSPGGSRRHSLAHNYQNTEFPLPAAQLAEVEALGRASGRGRLQSRNKSKKMERLQTLLRRLRFRRKERKSNAKPRREDDPEGGFRGQSSAESFDTVCTIPEEASTANGRVNGGFTEHNENRDHIVPRRLTRSPVRSTPVVRYESYI